MHSIQGIPLLACSESERVCRNACGVQLQTQSISMTVQLKWGVMNEIRLGLDLPTRCPPHNPWITIPMLTRPVSPTVVSILNSHYSSNGAFAESGNRSHLVGKQRGFQGYGVTDN